jgi:hypothetical protein
MAVSPIRFFALGTAVHRDALRNVSLRGALSCGGGFRVLAVSYFLIAKSVLAGLLFCANGAIAPTAVEVEAKNPALVSK